MATSIKLLPAKNNTKGEEWKVPQISWTAFSRRLSRKLAEKKRALMFSIKGFHLHLSTRSYSEVESQKNEPNCLPEIPISD